MPTKHKTKPPVRLWLTCSCGGSLLGQVSPAVAAFKIRDIFIRCHVGDGHTVNDKSQLNDQSAMLRTEIPPTVTLT